MATKITNRIRIPSFKDLKYPWKGMRRGQSFTVKTASERDNGLRVARALDIKATSRKVKGGFRLWRTA